MLNFQQLQNNISTDARFYRAKVPGGWLVAYYYFDAGGTTFVPDPEHKWDGSSLP